MFVRWSNHQRGVKDTNEGDADLSQPRDKLASDGSGRDRV